MIKRESSVEDFGCRRISIESPPYSTMRPRGQLTECLTTDLEMLRGGLLPDEGVRTFEHVTDPQVRVPK